MYSFKRVIEGPTTNELRSRASYQRPSRVSGHKCSTQNTKVWSVLSSPHGHKKAQDQYKRVSSKRRGALYVKDKKTRKDRVYKF